MSLLRWFEEAFGPRVRPAQRVRARLALDVFEDRVVPSGGGTEPPAQGSPESQSYNFTINPGDWLYAGQVSNVNLLATTDSNGYDWFVMIDAATGSFTATILNYDADYDPTASLPAVEGDFLPNPDKHNLVWDPDQATWRTVAAGTVFPDDVRGYEAADRNYVLLQAQNPTPPAQPKQAGPKGVTVTANPDGSVEIIFLQPGISVTVVPGNGTTPPSVSVRRPPNEVILQPPEPLPPPRPDRPVPVPVPTVPNPPPGRPVPPMVEEGSPPKNDPLTDLWPPTDMAP